MPRIYNLINDKLPDDIDVYETNDHLIYKLASFKTSNLPSKIDLRSKMPPVIDQQTVGSCTSCAVAAAYAYCDDSWVGSILFLYYNTRMLDGSTNFDNGTSLSQTVNALNKYGICNDQTWPYISSYWNIQPANRCYVEGELHQAIDYSHVDQTMDQMKGCLSSGYPFVIGIYVYSSFESNIVEQTGNVPMPGQGEQLLGGHAICVVGYDDDNSVWICRNSWGISWGDSGYFYLPYAYLVDQNIASDAWKITKVETDGTYIPTDPVQPVNPIDPIPINPVDPPQPQIKGFKIIPKLKSTITSSDVLLKDLLV